MNPDVALQWFGYILMEKQAVLEEHRARFDESNTRFQAESRALFKRLFPRCRYNVNRMVGYPEHTSWLAGWTGPNGVGDHLWIARRSDERQYEYVLDVLAQDCPLHVTDGWLLYSTVSETSYSSMGWSACKYAKQHAEQEAEQARRYSVPVEVRDQYDKFDPPVKTQYETHYGVHNYEVWVRLDSVGIAVLRCKPTCSLRDEIKRLLKAGVCPRVYYPFLPVGIEEKMGLDYFGNDKKA